MKARSRSTDHRTAWSAVHIRACLISRVWKPPVSWDQRGSSCFQHAGVLAQSLAATVNEAVYVRDWLLGPAWWSLTMWLGGRAERRRGTILRSPSRDDGGRCACGTHPAQVDIDNE